MSEFENQSPEVNNKPEQPIVQDNQQQNNQQQYQQQFNNQYQQPFQPQYQQPINIYEQKDPKKGLAIASLILGIISIVLSCIIYIAFPCGVIAIILGAMSTKSTAKGMAITGIVLGSIGVFMSIIFIAIVLFGYRFFENIVYYYNTY